MRRKLLDDCGFQIAIADASVESRNSILLDNTALPRYDSSPAVLNRKSTLCALLALILLSFFGTLTLSASMLPSYDWRYSVISHLFSPRDNPSHYRLAAGG